MHRVSLSDDGQVVIIASPYAANSVNNSRLLVAVYARGDIKTIEGTLQ